MNVLAAIFTTEDVWSRADVIAIWTLIAGFFGVVIAVFTLRRGNKNSSVASMIPLNAEIREMYDHYLESLSNASFNTPEELEALELKIASRLEKLMNVLELSAAIEVEGTLSGVSRTLMKDYLQRTLEDLIADDYTSSKVSGLLQDENTYIFIRRFLKSKTRVNSLLPPKWYAYPDVPVLKRARSWFRY
jgi:uncharacterized protein YbcC (UPF0753/DUF2309 family)